MNFRPFETIQPAPPDPILGLNDAFRKDANAQKINLTVGVFQDENGTNPVLRSVKQAERMLLEQETTKDYLGIGGDESYARAVQQVVFGPKHPVVTEGRGATIHTPGGTGALRVGGELLATQFPGATLWLSDPTWPNHPGIFRSAGLKVATYPYYDAATHGVNIGALLAALEKVPDGDIVLLHGCCHNPTGADPSPDHWRAILEVFKRRPIIPFLDFAYQGFGQGVEEDAFAVRLFASSGVELIVSSSFSKNFGLYRERVGALTVVTGGSGVASVVMSRIKQLVRTNYSNPPAHGSKVVELVLGEPELRKMWEREVVEMRDRIREMRRLFVETLKKYGAKRNFDFLLDQKGMFSYSGIGKADVLRLRDEYGIYMVESGRINVAAMTRSKMDYLCRSIAEVVGA